jgi:hypothetical protein
MSVWGRILSWLGPKVTGEAEAANAADQAWKWLEAAVAANTPEPYGVNPMMADLPKINAENEARRKVLAEREKVYSNRLTTAEQPKKARKKRARNVSRETFPKKRRKRSK